MDECGFPVGCSQAGRVQAALVFEISGYLRFRAIDLRELEVESHMYAAEEQALVEVRDVEYGAPSNTLKSLRAHYPVALAKRAGQNPASTTTELRGENTRVQQLQCDVQRIGQNGESVVKAARRRAAERYWDEVAQCRLPEEFFANTPPHRPLARVPRLFPIWWGRFVQSLQHVLQRTNPLHCRLIEQLPNLRTEAAKPGQRLVLAALVDNWRAENAERFGLFEEIHFPMLERRSLQKRATVSAWFDARAPGFKSDPAIRRTANQRLHECFGCVPLDELHHGRN